MTMADEECRTYRLEVEIQENGIIRDPFGWIIGRADDDWMEMAVRHETSIKTLSCYECGGRFEYNLRRRHLNYCPLCGARLMEP